METCETCTHENTHGWCELRDITVYGCTLAADHIGHCQQGYFTACPEYTNNKED